MWPPRRAHRYPLALPVRYRRRERGTWSDGLTRNISDSGVLFAPAGPTLVAGTVLQFTIRLPAAAPRRGATIRCIGRVVRVTEGECGTPTVMAVTIDKSRLAQTQE